METEVQLTWQQMQEQLSMAQITTSLSLVVYLALGGILGVYIRFLYSRCSGSQSDGDSFSRVFPLLILATIGVIAVVKSSVALSLGLVGALSIVRFRAAIKDPEELVYLFLCIAVGLALGAAQPLLAIILTVVATLFILSMYAFGKNRRRQNILMTVTGDTHAHFNDSPSGVFAAVRDVVGAYAIQRLDLTNGRSQIRITLPPLQAVVAADVVTQLQSRLSNCDFSYVNIHGN